MPELPEVETLRRELAGTLPGRLVTQAWGYTSGRFAAATEVAGTRFEDVGRRGKYLLAALADGRELVIHLGMTGQLRCAGPSALVQPHARARRPSEERAGVVAGLGAPADPYVRARWQLEGGSVLEYRDVRMFGRIAVVARGDYRSLPTLACQGPEPWDPELDEGGFWRRLRASRARIKTQLLSQRPIAGVGNIYADEGLWRARVRPGSREVTRAQAARLLTGLRDALESGLANGGTTLRDYRTLQGAPGGNQAKLQCYGRWGSPCERCGTELRRSVIDGRSSTWCPACQR